MVYVEIISGLWIGNVDMMYNKKFLQDNQISLILNCTHNFKFSDLPNIKNVRIPLSDNLMNNIDQLRIHKDKILKFIDSSLEQHNILLCCYDGISNSPFIVSLYLIKYGDITKDNIKKIIQSKSTEISMDYDLELLDL
jgi:protein-tyrosine phosphatase